MNATAIQATTDQQANRNSYSIPAAYLRAFLTVLVVAHHSVLAYHQYAPPVSGTLAAMPRLWQAFPVVDSQKADIFTLLVSFNDIFFMSLMFFVSGLFVWHSLQRKGVARFLTDRAQRLGIPFLVCAVLLAPVAYYPAYLQRTAAPHLTNFIAQWISLGDTPAGPAWFLWVLLAFDGLAAMIFLRLPSSARHADDTKASSWAASTRNKPFAQFVLLVCLSATAYVPLAMIFNGMSWTAFGPFNFQTSRILHYAVYFLLGVAAGALGLTADLFDRNGRLARRWFLWSSAAAVVFFIEMALVIAAFTVKTQPRLWEAAASLGFVFACAAISFAVLAYFARFVQKSHPWLNSLSRNAYGIYLLHYAFVSWLQYSLLKMTWGGFAKGLVVFLAATVLSWTTAAALRRIPVVAKLI